MTGPGWRTSASWRPVRGSQRTTWRCGASRRPPGLRASTRESGEKLTVRDDQARHRR